MLPSFHGTQCTPAAAYSPPTPLGKWQKVGYGLTEIYSLPSLSSNLSHLPLALSSFINDRPTRNSLIVGWKWKRDKERGGWEESILTTRP